jgi:hypothetical protein
VLLKMASMPCCVTMSRRLCGTWASRARARRTAWMTNGAGSNWGSKASVSSTAGAVRFTINLRVVAKDVWDRRREQRSYMPARPAPNVGYGPFEWWQRIGRLMPGGQDTWWTLKAGQPGARLAGEVIDVIRAYALPAMLAQRQLVNQADPIRGC